MLLLSAGEIANSLPKASFVLFGQRLAILDSKIAPQILRKRRSPLVDGLMLSFRLNDLNNLLLEGSCHYLFAGTAFVAAERPVLLSVGGGFRKIVYFLFGVGDQFGV